MAHDYQSVLQTVRQLIAEQLHKKPEDITEDSTLESLGADSLDRVEFVMNVEEKFHIQVNDEEAEKISTVRDAVTYILTLVNK